MPELRRSSALAESNEDFDGQDQRRCLPGPQEVYLQWEGDGTILWARLAID